MKIPANEVLARNIKRIREDKQLSSKQLALLADTTPQVMSKVERGDANPTLKRLESIASALNVSLSQLFEHKT
jgi:transcriptional regulator with XRE-family HTH domain